MEVYQRIIDLPEGSDISNWRNRAAELEDWIKTQRSNSLTAMLAPATAQCLEAEVRSEEVRRWTLTAVAIQQFKQQNDEWPKALAELESIGLNFNDYSDAEKNVFGYEIDGDKVFLWKQSPDLTTYSGISKTRPLPTKKDDDLSDFVLELN